MTPESAGGEVMAVPSSRQPRIALLVVVFLMSCLCMLIAGIEFGLGPFALDKTYVPEYPGAQQAQVFTGAQIATVIPFVNANAPFEGWTDKVVTFVTTDSPQRVLALYRDAIGRRILERWESDTNAHPAESLWLYSFGRSSMYRFRVDTEEVGART